MLQLDLGITPLSNLEVVSMLNTINISHACLYYSSTRTSKYNPRVYLGYVETYAQHWNYDSTTPSLTWPESYQKLLELLK